MAERVDVNLAPTLDKTRHPAILRYFTHAIEFISLYKVAFGRFSVRVFSRELIKDRVLERDRKYTHKLENERARERERRYPFETRTYGQRHRM